MERQTMSHLKACAAVLGSVLILSACVLDVEEPTDEERVGDVSQAVKPGSGPLLCVLTIDCGGICGTEKEVQRFLKQCDKKSNANGPVGPCYSDCWNVCVHAHSNGPNLVACTKECMVGLCPAKASSVELSSP